MIFKILDLQDEATVLQKNESSSDFYNASTEIFINITEHELHVKPSLSVIYLLR